MPIDSETSEKGAKAVGIVINVGGSGEGRGGVGPWYRGSGESAN